MHNWKIEFTIRVLQILMSTDEKHPINSTQIMNKLKDWYNLDCSERRTVYEAVELLRRMDLNIESCPAKRDGYYLVSTVSLAQIKMLVDTVTRSKLYTEETKKRVIRKIYDRISPEYCRILKAMSQLK